MSAYDFELDLNTVNTQSVIINWIKPNSTVLEFGPANGRMTKYLSMELNCDVTIVEFDGESGKEAKKYAKKAYIGARKGDALKTYWHREKKFDYIVFADVLEHLSDPKGVLIEALLHLEDDGMILVSIPNIAHNSVIIDLINDNFEYQRTGLLDVTHVHFFTYRTFVELINEIGLVINDEIPIYSMVGANEIKNSYEDVPYSIEKFLRKRKTGSVYQYVFSLKKGIGKSSTFFDKPFIQEEEHKYEAQCFYTAIDCEVFDDVNRKHMIVEKGHEIEFVFEISGFINRVRFDPLLSSCLIQVKEASYFSSADEWIELPIESDNSYMQKGNLYLFKVNHPTLYYRLNGIFVKRIRFVFEIIDDKPDFALVEKIIGV